MGVLVVGSVALDSVRTPFGYEEDILGGSATYFSIAASYFTAVSVVGVVGDDFPEAHFKLLQAKGIDTSGLERQKGRTFRWKGEYGFDMNAAKTLDTQLNVFAEFSPKIRSEHRGAEYLFLGNIDPELQLLVLDQVKRPRLIACDTMNYWISNKPDALRRILSHVDLLIINDAEVRQLAGDANLITAARGILSRGPKSLVVKRGEHGVLMFNSRSVFGAPAFPLETVYDPTGAGDSFAGGLMGYLAATGKTDEPSLRKAIVFGTVMASFNVSEFGPRRLGSLTYTEIEERYRDFRRLTHFEDI